MSAGTQQRTVFDALRERVPTELIKSRQQGGSSISYISWYTAVELLDERAPGWMCEIKEVGHIGDKVFVRVALTIEGVTRENVGCEDDDKDGYGDAFSNSYGMAIRRAAALFGLGLHLYDKSNRGRSSQPQRQQPPQRPTQPAPVATSKAMATKTQINQLLEYEAALEEYDVKPSTLRDKLEEKYHTREPNRLTDSEAIDYIEWLKARLAKKREAI